MTWRPRSKEHFLRLLMLAGVVLMAAFITQCRMVTDNLVRPDAEMLGSDGPNSCVRACIRAANEAKEDENERHREALEDCRGGGGRGDGDDDDDDDLTATNTKNQAQTYKKGGKGDKDDRDDRDKRDKRGDGDRDDDRRRNACIEAEEDRHKAALKAINEQRRDCINGCHHQGGGVGGR